MTATHFCGPPRVKTVLETRFAKASAGEGFGEPTGRECEHDAPFARSAGCWRAHWQILRAGGHEPVAHRVRRKWLRLRDAGYTIARERGSASGRVRGGEEELVVVVVVSIKTKETK